MGRFIYKRECLHSLLVINGLELSMNKVIVWMNVSTNEIG